MKAKDLVVGKNYWLDSGDGDGFEKAKLISIEDGVAHWENIGGGWDGLKWDESIGDMDGYIIRNP